MLKCPFRYSVALRVSSALTVYRLFVLVQKRNRNIFLCGIESSIRGVLLLPNLSANKNICVFKLIVNILFAINAFVIDC